MKAIIFLSVLGLSPFVTALDYFGSPLDLFRFEKVQCNIENYKDYMKKPGCHKCDLRGADLAGADFRGANLWRWDFEGADLSGADFEGADLSGAVLEDADLSGANLSDVCLRGALLKGAILEDTILHHIKINESNRYSCLTGPQRLSQNEPNIDENADENADADEDKTEDKKYISPLDHLFLFVEADEDKTEDKKYISPLDHLFLFVEAEDREDPSHYSPWPIFAGLDFDKWK